MLAARRLARRPTFLPPCTCRFASTATATAPTHVPSYSPPPRSPTRDHPLFSGTVLPPLPPPLPSDSAETWSSRPTLISPSASHEQLAILSACLTSGDLTRAEEVLVRISSHWAKVHGSSRPVSRQASLASLLPPKVHGEVLRAYFASALVAEASVPRAGASAARKRNALIEKAWAYLNTLMTAKQWELIENRTHVNLAIDAGVLAVVLKGLTALQASDDSLDQNVPALLERMHVLDIALYDVLRDPIFDVALPSYLGPVTREDALELLNKQVQPHEALHERWSSVFEDASRKIALEREGNARDQTKRQYKELDPTQREGGISAPLMTLRTNLMTLAMPDDSGALTPTARQSLLEESSYDAARQLYIHEMEELAKVGKGKERGMQSNWLQSRMFEWLTELQKRLVAESKMKKGPWGKDEDIEPFMRLLEPNKMALITIVELLRLCGGGGVSDGMKSARAILHVGKAIENEYHAQELRKSTSEKEFWKQMDSISQAASLSPTGEPSQPNKERDLNLLWKRDQKLREEAGSPWTPAWTPFQRARVGGLLVSALMQTAVVERTGRDAFGETVVEQQPAFSHSYQFVRGNKIGVIKVNPVVAQRMDQDPLSITLHPRFLPMIVKPKPWISYNNGCYLKHPSLVMRTKDSAEQIQHLKQASDADTLEDIFAGLDVLGSVPWRINRKVFDVVSEVWNTGEALADIPEKDQLSKPLNVEVPDRVESDMRAKDSYRHRVRKALQERRSLHSNRCDVNYKLEIARAFLDETFYFPHNLDFRGRAYPIPPNLSHIGNDLCRGILMFGEAKQLGDRGLRWLKIHLANVRGYDKASFDEREAYAMEHLEDIYDSADRPLEGRRWWLQAEDPWQCLATCFELTAALRSPVPSDYLSALPIHQDGTCNGLQHYAALGGDIAGASQVNLAGGDRPSDVYTGVAEMANEVINRDAANGHKQALLLQGKVTRKVVKQTVMTTVYGVTFIGAKKQIEKQLKERGDIPAEELYTLALYLGRIVLNSIGDVFKGATAIQTWLNRSARLIAKSIPPSRIQSAMQSDPKGAKKGKPDLSRIPKELMTSVIWTTPLGLPVVQPYRKAKKRQILTVLQSVSIADPSVPSEVDPRAQATAFPPNFIHSLDATHMMMTALACKDKIAFASVHDSYWTHACSVDEMSIILRDQFIELHSTDILGNLRKEFLRRYEGHVIPVVKLPTGKNNGPARAHDADDEDDAYGDELATDLPLFGEGKKSVVEPETANWVFAKGNAIKVGTPFASLADHLPPLPERGSFDLNRIRDSLYFFS